MNQRATLLILSLVPACSGAPSGSAPAVEDGAPASAVVPWRPVERLDDGVFMVAPARVVSAPTASADVMPTHRAVVRDLRVTEGDSVEAGQVVAVVASPELADAAAVVTGAKGQLRIMQARRAHLASLRTAGLTKKDALFQLDVSISSLKAQRDQAQAILSAASVSEAGLADLARKGVLELRASIDGVVADVHGRPGHAVGPDSEPLVHIRGVAPSRIEAQLPTDVPAEIRAEFAAADGRAFALNATARNHVLEGASGLMRVWFDFESPQRLPAHLRGTVRLSVEDAAASVPAEAVGCDEKACRVRRLRAGESATVVVRRVWANGAIAIVQGDLTTTDRVAPPTETAP